MDRAVEELKPQQRTVGGQTPLQVRQPPRRSSGLDEPSQRSLEPMQHQGTRTAGIAGELESEVQHPRPAGTQGISSRLELQPTFFPQPLGDLPAPLPEL